jgi:4-hydroxy-2-oxoheptanedioate aldolase
MELSASALLKELVENSGVIGIKTSFEDEGASFNEVIRLKELCNQSGTKLLLKISGAEAKRDLFDSQIIGVKGIVAPMIESAFALDKFVKSAKMILPDDILSNVQLGVNIETFGAYKNYKDILNSDGFHSLYHVTLGRVDFVSSMGKDRSFVDSNEMYDIAVDIFSQAREKTKKVYLGGAITINSEVFLKNLFAKGLLDKFETRYVMYDPALALNDLSNALLNGQKLELNILRNRQSLYRREAEKEQERIHMIASRVGE